MGNDKQNNKPKRTAFGQIMFEVVKGAQEVYTTNGIRSKRVARALIELVGPDGGTGHYIAGTVYARMQPDGDVKADVVFFGSRNQSCMRPGSDSALQNLNEWRRSAADKYKEWATTQGVAAETTHVDTGVAIDIAKF